MVRHISAAIVGYITMAIVVMVGFTALWSVLGMERAFAPDTYDVSMTWILPALAIALVAAVLGGLVCRLISRDMTGTKILVGIVIVLGIASVIFTLLGAPAVETTAQSEEITGFQAMQLSKSPIWVTIAEPIIGVIGALAGGKMVKRS